jgi:cytochrome c-type biogenesis protein CcmH
MIELWMGFLALIVIAFGFLAIPYMTNVRRGSLVRESTNIDIYKAQLADLESDKQAEKIGAEEYESLSQEIKRNLLIDTEKQALVTDHDGGRWIIGVMALVLVVSSVMLYNKLGAENELAITNLLKKSSGQGYTEEDARSLLERLMVQSEKTPEDVEVWYLIGRLNFDFGQYDDAVIGFSNVIQNLPEESKDDQAVALAQLAQAQFFANDRKLDKATESLLLQALEINPRDNTSLGLLGVASYDRGEYLNAVRYWTRLLGLTPPNNPNSAAIQGGLEKAKSQLSQEELATFKAELKAKIKTSIQVTVSIDNSIKAKLPENADLFVLAKAEQGPPMPLAVQRIVVSQFPITVILDDSMAMMESLRMSEFDNVIITARISVNGVGNAKAGDLEGASGVISTKENKVNVLISKELK